MALLQKAAGQGHAYAMRALGAIHNAGNEHEQALKWFTKGAEAGLPKASSISGAISTRGRAGGRLTIWRRRPGTGARRTRETAKRRTI